MKVLVGEADMAQLEVDVALTVIEGLEGRLVAGPGRKSTRHINIQGRVLMEPQGHLALCLSAPI